MTNSAAPSSSKSIFDGKTVTAPLSARLVLDGRTYTNFWGSGYLALSALPELHDAVRRVLEQGYPFAQQIPAATGVRYPVMEAVERAAAAACATEASVYFASGYFIGRVGLAAISPAPDLILLDEFSHYSLREAVTLIGLPTFEFAHCDVDALRDLLHREARPKQRPLVVTDGVFAATGRVPPLEAYAAVLAPYGGRMFIDEAHSFGVVGANGRGAGEYCGVEHIATGGATLSKALCAQGAFVACTSATAARLRMTPCILGASAGSPLSAAAATASLEYVAAHPELRADLTFKSQYLRAGLRSLGLVVLESPAPLVSFRLRDGATMLAVQRRVFSQGFCINYMRSYVGSGTEGVLRCSVFRDHSREDLDGLISTIRQVI